MSNNIIKIVSDDFETAFTELKKLNNSLGEYKSTLENCYSVMKANWSGSAAKAFESYVPKLMADYKTLTSNMDTVAENIKKMGDEMESLDQQIAKSM